MEIVPGPGWKGLKRGLRGRTSVFIGKMDAGKTTLVRWLLTEFLAIGEKVALVDSDIGQSSLGLPGTVSMKVFGRPEDVENFEPDRMLFIGVTNPARKIPFVVDAASKMVGAARAVGVRTILVDTTGLVLGSVGRALKVAKIRAIGPDNVIAVERVGELEHIIFRLEGVRIYRLRASRLAREKTRAARIKYRAGRIREYLKDSRTLSVRAERVKFVSDAGEVLPPAPGALVALNRDDETVALGVYEGLTEGKVVIRTPLKSLRGVNSILIGDMIPF